MNGTVTIKTAAAEDDARSILNIISEISSDMETLDQAIKSTIPSGIQTSWSETVKSNWDGYYTADIPESLAEMGESANNIKLAVERTTAYSNETE